MKAMWATMIVAGALQDLLSSLFTTGDDGQNDYDKLPLWQKEQNFILPNPLGGFLMIPLPPLLRGIVNMGRATMAIGRGQNMSENLWSGTTSLANDLNPIGEFNNFLNFVAPSVLDPFVDLSTNKDWLGNAIHPEAAPGATGKVASQSYWSNTNPAYVSIADWLSKVTGRQGDYIGGAAEIYPDTIDYAVNFTTGGVGTTVAKTYNLFQKMATGHAEELELSDIPFVRRYATQAGEREQEGHYYDKRDQVLRVRTALKAAMQEGDTETANAIRARYSDEIRIMTRINAIENARRKWSTQIRKIRDNDRISDDQKDKLVKGLKDRQKKIVQQGSQIMQDAGIQ
jgi:hypothetical protein